MNKIVISNWKEDYVLNVWEEGCKRILEFKASIVIKVLKIMVNWEPIYVTKDEVHFIS